MATDGRRQPGGTCVVYVSALTRIPRSAVVDMPMCPGAAPTRPRRAPESPAPHTAIAGQRCRAASGKQVCRMHAAMQASSRKHANAQAQPPTSRLLRMSASGRPSSGAMFRTMQSPSGMSLKSSSTRRGWRSSCARPCERRTERSRTLSLAVLKDSWKWRVSALFFVVYLEKEGEGDNVNYARIMPEKIGKAVLFRKAIPAGRMQINGWYMYCRRQWEGD